MAWTPAKESLDQVLSLLRRSEHPAPADKQALHDQLEAAKREVEFSRYLMFVLAKMGSEAESTRSIAGILLKNTVREMYHVYPPDVRQYIKTEGLGSLSDASPMVRSIAGILITSIAACGGLKDWPELIPALLGVLQNPAAQEAQGKPFVVEAALSALQKICEDCLMDLDAPASANVLNAIIQSVLPFFRHPTPRLRSTALACLNMLIAGESPAISANIDAYISNLFALGSDEQTEVRKHVCQALVLLLELRLDRLMPYMDAILKFIMACTKMDEEIAQEACEFWLALADVEPCRPLLAAALPELLPVLLRCMRYSEIDILTLKDEDDWQEKDKASDVKPRVAHVHMHHAEDDETDDDDDDDDDMHPEAGEGWSLRKCAAATLDLVSTVFGDAILPHIWPVLKAFLAADDWALHEAAILAIGAVAEGCLQGMAQDLAALVPFFFRCLASPRGLVRSITCWALSRYAAWLVQHERLGEVLQQLLPRLLDGNKHVQEAACSAFATLEEEAGALLTPFLPHILPALTAAFDKYQQKNLLMLYDAIGTLAEAVGSALAAPECVAALLPPLMGKWEALQDTDRDLFPLLECLSSVALAMGMSFAPYAEAVFARSLRLIAAGLFEAQHVDSPDKDFIVVSLDLMSGVVEGLGAASESLVSRGNTLTLLFQCMMDSAQEVRQSAFALLGDVAKVCYVHLRPHVGDFLGVLARNLDPTVVPVCNNATWALGEMALQMKSDIKALLPSFLPALLAIMNMQDISKTLLENTAITLGRLGLACPEDVAPHLQNFIHPWCVILRNIRDNDEKDSAFRGVCALIHRNPHGIITHFVFFCDAANSWQQPSPVLRDMFHQIFHSFKQQAGADWASFFGSFPEALRTSLARNYGL